MTAARVRELVLAGAAGAAVVCAAQQPAPRTMRAVRAVVGGTPVRFVSRRSVCAVPFEAATFDACDARPGQTHPDSVYRAVRAALAGPGNGSRGVACLRFSREVAVGDSTLVMVGVTGAVVADGLVESRARYVWFRRAGGVETVRVDEGPDRGTSDSAPITSAAQC